MCASKQFLVIYILLSPGNHLEYIKELLLNDAYELFKLFCAALLSVCCFKVDGGPRH